MVVVAIFTFVNVWNEFFFALVFLSDPEKATLPLKLAQFLGSEGRGRFGALAAATVMAIIPALVMFGIIQRKFSDNFLAGAVKG
jgi:multiple sugar transport system permease protein